MSVEHQFRFLKHHLRWFYQEKKKVRKELKDLKKESKKLDKETKRQNRAVQGGIALMSNGALNQDSSYMSSYSSTTKSMLYSSLDYFKHGI